MLYLHQQANQLDLRILVCSSFNYSASREASSHISLSSTGTMWSLTLSWFSGTTWLIEALGDVGQNQNDATINWKNRKLKVR